MMAGLEGSSSYSIKIIVSELIMYNTNFNPIIECLILLNGISA